MSIGKTSPLPAAIAPSASTSEPTGHRNKLLRTITTLGYADFEGRLERVSVGVPDILARQGEPFTHLWFPETCVISLVSVMTDGSSVEVGTIGNEGFAGIPAYLEADASETNTFCQIAGSALRLPVGDLIAASEASAPLRKLLGRYTQSYLSQVSQSAACNSAHDIEQRCARWLLMTHDRVDGADRFSLKQEFLAFMLGVRRAGVTIAAGKLQARGMIRYRRGMITIVDRPALERAACECYAIVRKQFDRLLPN